MKKIIYYFVSALLLMAPLSCKKDDPAPSATLPETPEALAEHNDKSGGIYKGAFANATNSGMLKVVLQGGTKNVVITLNGTTRTLTTTGLDTWTSGDEIVAAVFTSGDWTVTVGIAADGSSFDMSGNLAGQTSFDGTVLKESSTLLVRVYEGTYAGDASGKWNFATQGTYLSGVYSGDAGSDNFVGSIVGTTISVASSGSVTAVGTTTNEAKNASGTWTGSSTSGTWTGVRKI
jgi:hypothetical protein